MIVRLTHRADFLRAARAAYQARTGVVVQARRREPDEGDAAASWTADTIRLGFTATKKVGNAVIRNRAKRRLREAARQLIPVHGLAGHDYVFIARAGTLDRPWQGLLDDVKAALIRLSRPKPPVQSHPVSNQHATNPAHPLPPQDPSIR